MFSEIGTIDSIVIFLVINHTSIHLLGGLEFAFPNDLSICGYPSIVKSCAEWFPVVIKKIRLLVLGQNRAVRLLVRGVSVNQNSERVIVDIVRANYAVHVGVRAADQP